MERRDFIRIGVLGGVAGLVAPRMVLGGSLGHTLQGKMAGGLYYTKDAPGRWSKKIAPHLPIIEKAASADGVQIQVVSGHPMTPDYKHYIVKHMLLDGDFRFITEKVFNPVTDKQALSKFELKSYSGPLYAVSVCNLHDAWLDVIEV